MTRLIFALERFTGSEGLFDSMTEWFILTEGPEGGLNPLSQPFFRAHPSPSIKTEKKSQNRLFIVASSFRTQFCVSLLLLELVLPSNKYKCLLFSWKFAWYVALSAVLWFVLEVFSIKLLPFFFFFSYWTRCPTITVFIIAECFPFPFLWLLLRPSDPNPIFPV